MTNLFGIFLVGYRKMLGLGQSEAARRFGVPQSTLSRWEWGHNPANETHLGKISRVLETSVEELRLMIEVDVKYSIQPICDLLPFLRQLAEVNLKQLTYLEFVSLLAVQADIPAKLPLDLMRKLVLLKRSG